MFKKASAPSKVVSTFFGSDDEETPPIKKSFKPIDPSPTSLTVPVLSKSDVPPEPHRAPAEDEQKEEEEEEVDPLDAFMSNIHTEVSQNVSSGSTVKV
jgi:hypothetical protein